MKTLKVLGVILLALVLIIGGVVLWQRDNIASVYRSVQYSEEQLKEQMTQDKNKTQEALDQYTGGAIRDLTEEEEEQIRSGELTPEEAVQKILNEQITEQLQENGKKENQHLETPVYKKNENVVKEPTKEEKITQVINTHVAKMYELKASFISKLADLEKRVISDYESLPKKKRPATWKKDIIAKYMGEAISIEKTADKEVEAVLSSLETQIKELGGDLQIVKTIRESYVEQKKLQKSYYIAKYK